MVEEPQDLTLRLLGEIRTDVADIKTRVASLETSNEHTANAVHGVLQIMGLVSGTLERQGIDIAEIKRRLDRVDA